MSSLARIRFVCSHCNKKLSVQPAAAGRTLPCPNSECGKPLTVPFDVIEAAEPNGTAVPVNPPGSAAFVTAAKPGAGRRSFFLPAQGVRRPEKSPQPCRAAGQCRSRSKGCGESRAQNQARDFPDNQP
jgi:hypothetical protein